MISANDARKLSKDREKINLDEILKQIEKDILFAIEMNKNNVHYYTYSKYKEYVKATPYLVSIGYTVSHHDTIDNWFLTISW